MKIIKLDWDSGLFVLLGGTRRPGYDVKRHPVARLLPGKVEVLGKVELPLSRHCSQVLSDPER